MFVFLSILCYIAITGGLLKAFPWLRTGIVDNSLAARDATRYYARRTWTFFKILVLGVLPLYAALVFGSSFWKNEYWLLSVLIIGMLPALLVMYALRLLRVPTAMTAEKVRTMGKWVYNHIPPTVVTPPPAPPAAAAVGFWRGLVRATGLPFRFAFRLIRLVLKALGNGLYMTPALPLKAAGGLVYILGELADEAQYLMRRLALVLAAWCTLHLFLISLVLVDVHFEKVGIKMRLLGPSLLGVIAIIGVLFVIISVASTDTVANWMARRAAARAGIAVGKGMSLAMAMPVMGIVVALAMVGYMRLAPAQAHAYGRSWNAGSLAGLKMDWLDSLRHEEPQFLYTRAISLIPKQYEPVIKDGKLERYLPVSPSSPVKAGVRGVVVNPDQPPEMSTGQATIKVYWEVPGQPGSLLVSHEVMEREGHWVAKDWVELHQALPDPLAPPAPPLPIGPITIKAGQEMYCSVQLVPGDKLVLTRAVADVYAKVGPERWNLDGTMIHVQKPGHLVLENVHATAQTVAFDVLTVDGRRALKLGDPADVSFKVYNGKPFTIFISRVTAAGIEKMIGSVDVGVDGFVHDDGVRAPRESDSYLIRDGPTSKSFKVGEVDYPKDGGYYAVY